jgi:2-phospho-L-lactate guanylyltransferase
LLPLTAMSRSLPDSFVVAGSGGVVVPVKRLSLAKSRLAAYGDERRQALALAFAADVVVAARDVAQVLVVTDDERAAALLGALGARVVADDPDAGLNPALEHGAELLRSDQPTLGVATLSADLPALRTADLVAVLALVPPGGRGFVSDVAGTGTTLLAAGPGALLAPAFGTGSRTGHLRSGAVELTAAAGLRRDVDTPEDLEAAFGLGLGEHTSIAVQGLF